MDKDEALRLALDALENSIDTVRHEYETDWRHGMPTRLVQLERMKIGVEDHERAITAIKEALAQPEQEPVATGVIRTLVSIDKDGNETWKHEPFFTMPPLRRSGKEKQ